jgi:hypothetical protein
MFAAPTPAASRVAVPAAFATTTAVAAFSTRDHDDDCGRGNAWGCRRNDDRYDRRRDDDYDRDRRRDRYERERYERMRYEQARRERERYERERYERERYERERYERERYERDRYRVRPVACIRAGSRVVGGVVVTVCLP